MRLLIAILVLLVAWIYVRGALSVCPLADYQLLQVPIAALSLNLLYEKKPIVINEPVVDPTQLLTSVFKFQYVYASDVKRVSKGVVVQNKAKFAIVYSSDHAYTLQVMHPYHHVKIKIKCEKHQCVIIPVRYKFMTEEIDINMIMLHDIITGLSGIIC